MVFGRVGAGRRAVVRTNVKSPEIDRCALTRECAAGRWSRFAIRLNDGPATSADPTMPTLRCFKPQHYEQGAVASVDLDDAAFDRSEERLGPVGDAQFAKNIRDVDFHRALHHAELSADFLVAQPAPEHLEHFELAR